MSSTISFTGANGSRDVVTAFNDGTQNRIGATTSWAVSTNGGTSFTDQGALTDGGNAFQPTNPNSPIFPYGANGGQPVLARYAAAGTSTIYLATPQNFVADPSDNGDSAAVHVYKSTNDGATFQAFGNALTGLSSRDTDIPSDERNYVDPSIAVDPGNGNVYVAASINKRGGGLNGGFGISAGIGVNWMANDDASFSSSQTWVALIPDGPQDDDTYIAGPWITTGPDHSVYVTWVDCNAAVNGQSTTEEVLMLKAAAPTTSNSTLAFYNPANPSSTDADVVATLHSFNKGEAYYPNSFGSLGDAVGANMYPQVIVNPANAQDVYLVYSSATPGSANGGYGDYADIYLRTSANGGASWSDPVIVNDDANTNAIQYQPSVAITPNGRHLFIGFYDSRNDTNALSPNTIIDTYGQIEDINPTTGTMTADGPNFRISLNSFRKNVFLDLTTGAQIESYDANTQGDHDIASADDNYFYYSYAQTPQGASNSGHDEDVVLAKIQVPITNSTVVSHLLFYDGAGNSGTPWDNASGPDANDNNAISNRVPLTPGMAATQTNEDNAESNFNKGITGIMVDLSLGAGNHAAISQANIATVLANDFHFRVGIDNGSGITWADATTAQLPTAVSTTLGGGASGTDRVELTWPSGALKNVWLEVRVLASADTGLADLGGLYAGMGDVFYFANRVGDLSNENSVSYNTTALDVAQIHAHVSSGLPVDGLWDITKDGNVTALDVAQAHGNVGVLHWIDVSGGSPLAPDAAAATSSTSQYAGITGASNAPQWLIDWLTAAGDLNSGQIALDFQALAAEANTDDVALLIGANNVAISLGMDNTLLASLVAGLS